MLYRNETDPLLQVDRDWWWPDDVDKLRRAMAEWNNETENKSGGEPPFLT